MGLDSTDSKISIVEDCRKSPEMGHRPTRELPRRESQSEGKEGTYQLRATQISENSVVGGGRGGYGSGYMKYKRKMPILIITVLKC